MSHPLDPKLKALCDRVTAKRPRTVIDHIIQHGQVTTEELQSLYGYDHPPRAVRDVRENGIPLETFKVTSDRTGRKIAAYRFGDPSKIKRGRIGGRQAFSKQFKDNLVKMYGARDAITSQQLDPRYLQIDHRIPYEVAGDEAFDESKLEAYMLIDASSQRAKSWSCEHCENIKEGGTKEVCGTCFWAYPEKYEHVAMEQQRRLDIILVGDEVKLYDEAVRRAQSDGLTIVEWAKIQLLASLKRS